MANNTQNPFGKLTNYVLNPQQEDDKQPQAQQPTQYAQAATLQQPAQPRQQPAPQMFGQPQQPQPAQPRQTTMTPMTAGQRYGQMLQQNVPQAQAVASGLAQQVTAPAAAAQRGFEEAQREFAKKVAERRFTTPVARTQQLVSKAATGEELTPEEFAELQQVSTAREGFEEGTRPEDFAALQSYVTALGEAQKAKQYAGLAGTAAGRQQLLRQTARTPGYTSGQAMLDALLAGGVAPAAEQLQQVTQKYGAADELGLAQQRMAEEAKRTKEAGKEEVESSYKRLQDLLDAEDTGALAKLEKSIQDRVAQANKNVEDTNKLIDDVVPNIGTYFGDTDAEKRLMTLLGIDATKPEGQKLIRDIEFAPKDINLISKLKEVNPQTVTTENELKALKQLYKIGDIVKRGKPELAVEEGEDLGTLGEQKIGLSKEKLESDVKQAVSTLQSSVDTEKQNIRTQSVNDKDIERIYGATSLGSALENANKDLLKHATWQPLSYTDRDNRVLGHRLGHRVYGSDKESAIKKLLSIAEGQINKLNKMYKDSNYKVMRDGKYRTVQIPYSSPTKEEIDNAIKIYTRERFKNRKKPETEYTTKFIQERQKDPGARKFISDMLKLNYYKNVLTRRANMDMK